MLLSIGMMVKNEEQYLDKCLSSLTPILKNLDSELIIVDTGSTDNTVQIAKKYTDKIYFHKWNNNFSEIRNIVISYCKGDWFFCIDGDEVIENCDGIIDFFKSGSYKNYNSSTIYVKNLTDLSGEAYSIFPSLRLFKKDNDFKYINAVHNQPLCKQPILMLSVNCKHYGYISTDKELMERKYNRTVGILKSELKKDPENIYYLNQLSVSYGMHKDYNKAVNAVQKAYDCIIKKKENPQKHIYVFPELCLCYYNIHDYVNVEKYSKENLKYNKDLIDTYYYLGASSVSLKKYDQAMSALKMYLKLYKSYYTRVKDISIIDYTLDKVNEVYYMLYELNKHKKAYDKAQEYLLNITDKKCNVPAYMVNLHVSSKEYYKLKDYEENLILQDKYDDINKLYDALEDAYMLIDHEEVTKLIETFSLGDSPYNNLNSIRLKFENEKTVDIDAVNLLFQEIDLSCKPVYYGDLIYYMIYSKNDLSNILGKLSFEKLNEYLEYLTKKCKEFSKYVYDYVLKFEDKDDFYSIRINKELCRYLIILNKLDKDKFKNIYDYYLTLGVKYIKFVYSYFVIENEFWQAVRNAEERFFLCIYKSEQYEKSDKKVYFRYLKVALDFYPYMKNLIEYLLNKEKQQISGENSEFERYKVKVKSTIKALIENNKLEDASKIIREYEDIVKDDMEIVFLKSQLSLKKLKSHNTNYKM